MDQNQMFFQMKQAALARLADRDPNEIATYANVLYDDISKTFQFQSLGIQVSVHYPDYAFSPNLPGWHELVILHYLDLADGTLVAGNQIPFGQMKSGMVRGGGIDRKFETAIQDLHGLKEASFATVCERLGGERIASNADMSFRIPFMPRFPVFLKLWLPDEEFPASGRIFVDSSADHYLTIEDAVTVAELIIDALR